MLHLLSLFSGIGAFEKALDNVGANYRLMPGSRVALLKSATDIIRFGVVAALGDGFIVAQCEDGGIYKIYRSLILLSRDCLQIKMIRFEVLKND